MTGESLYYLTGIGAAVTVMVTSLLGGLWWLWRLIAGRLDKQDVEIRQLHDFQSTLRHDFDKETGGNSGGFREALDGIRKDVSELKENQAYIRGTVDQLLGKQ